MTEISSGYDGIIEERPPRNDGIKFYPLAANLIDSYRRTHGEEERILPDFIDKMMVWAGKGKVKDSTKAVFLTNPAGDEVRLVIERTRRFEGTLGRLSQSLRRGRQDLIQLAALNQELAGIFFQAGADDASLIDRVDASKDFVMMLSAFSSADFWGSSELYSIYGGAKNQAAVMNCLSKSDFWVFQPDFLNRKQVEDTDFRGVDMMAFDRTERKLYLIDVCSNKQDRQNRGNGVSTLARFERGTNLSLEEYMRIRKIVAGKLLLETGDPELARSNSVTCNVYIDSVLSDVYGRVRQESAEMVAGQLRSFGKEYKLPKIKKTGIIDGYEQGIR